MHPDQDQTRDLDIYPAQESNRWPFALQDDAQPTEPHCSGPLVKFFKQVVGNELQGKLATN